MRIVNQAILHYPAPVSATNQFIPFYKVNCYEKRTDILICIHLSKTKQHSGNSELTDTISSNFLNPY